MTAILSKTTRRVSGGFMEATEDMEGIMEKTGNGSTEVVHFELCFEEERVVLAPLVLKNKLKLYFSDFFYFLYIFLKLRLIFCAI